MLALCWTESPGRPYPKACNQRWHVITDVAVSTLEVPSD